MKITEITCAYEQRFTIPVGQIHLAVNLETEEAFICDMSPDKEYIPHLIEGWHFATVYNRIDATLIIPANSIVKQAEDENGNNYTHIPNQVVNR